MSSHSAIHPPQFSLRSLLAGIAAVAVLMSVGQVAGGEAALLVAGVFLAGVVLVALCRASDVELVPLGLCGLLVAWLIGFPPLILDWVAIDFWMGTVAVAALWEIVAPRRGIDTTPGSRWPRQHGAVVRDALPALVRWAAFAMLAISTVLLLGVFFWTTTTPFWEVARQAWQDYWWDYPVSPMARLHGLLRGTWFVYLLLVAAMVPAMRLRRRAADGPEAAILMRQVASLHTMSLLALAVIVLDALQSSFSVMSWPPRAQWHFFPAFYYVAAAVPSLLLLHAALLLILGRRALPYLRCYGWLPAVGFGAVALATAVFIATGMAAFPELR